MKQCKLCGMSLPLTDFHKTSNDRRAAKCKVCLSAYNRERAAIRRAAKSDDDPLYVLPEETERRKQACRCHSISPMGHRFRQEDLRCAHSGCTQEWFKHQRKPLPCSHIPVPRPPRPSETRTVEIAI